MHDALEKDYFAMKELCEAKGVEGLPLPLTAVKVYEEYARKLEESKS